MPTPRANFPLWLLASCALYSLFIQPPALAINQSSSAAQSQNVYPHNPDGELPTYQGTMVRVGLRLIHYRKAALGPGQSQITYLPGEVIKKTLRARIDKPNHFFIDSYHIETIPLKWIRKSHSYTMRLSLSRRSQQQPDVEKHLGYVDVKGSLRKQSQRSIYLLVGASSQTFFNHLREPYLKVVAGYGKARSTPPVNVATQQQRRRYRTAVAAGKTRHNQVQRRPYPPQQRRSKGPSYYSSSAHPRGRTTPLQSPPVASQPVRVPPALRMAPPPQHPPQRSARAPGQSVPQKNAKQHQPPKRR